MGFHTENLMNKHNYITPRQIMKLISEGREDEIPKSKTWYKFMDWYNEHKWTVPKLSIQIGISLQSMMKFMSGRFVIAPSNMKKIQEFLKRQEDDKTHT